MPVPAQFAGGHPAQRVFQALRIAVNDELGQLDEALPAAWELLRVRRPVRSDLLPFAGGPPREAVPRRQRAGLHLPAGLPGLRCGREPEAELLTRRAVAPTPGEIESNPRSKSAQLRAARKLDPATGAAVLQRAGRKPHGGANDARHHRRPPSRAPDAPQAGAAPAAAHLRPQPPKRDRARAPPPPTAVARPPFALRLGARAMRVGDARLLDRLVRGRAWIALLAIGLIGIVFMQVSLLKLNAGIGRAVTRGRHLRAPELEPARGHLQLDSGERIQAVAAKLGMVMPAAGDVHYLDGRGADGTPPPRRSSRPSP